MHSTHLSFVCLQYEAAIRNDGREKLQKMGIGDSLEQLQDESMMPNRVICCREVHQDHDSFSALLERFLDVISKVDYLMDSAYTLTKSCFLIWKERIDDRFQASIKESLQSLDGTQRRKLGR